jgi:hypothetical protein
MLVLLDRNRYQRVKQLIKDLRPMTTQFNLVRIGEGSDGSYLLPDDLEGIFACFSPGVGSSTKFEENLLDFDIPSFLLDGSISRLPREIPGLSFESKYLGEFDNVNTIRMESWVQIHTPNARELLLQMDIEGAEWNVLKDISEEFLSRFRILVIEFHHLERMFLDENYDSWNKILNKILKHFHVVHIHPNNYCSQVSILDLEIPRLMEFTFLNKNRIDGPVPTQTFPHPLDQNNVSNYEALNLPKCWYQYEIMDT